MRQSLRSVPLDLARCHSSISHIRPFSCAAGSSTVKGKMAPLSQESKVSKYSTPAWTYKRTPCDLHEWTDALSHAVDRYHIVPEWLSSETSFL